MNIRTNPLTSSTRPGRSRRLAVGACITMLLATTACGSDDAGDGAGSSDVDELTIADARARTTPAQASNGVVYVDLTSPVDDSLVSASVEPTIAGAVELHETMSMDGDGGGHQHGGQSDDEESDVTVDPAAPMTMEPVDRIELPADETVSLEPGGLHAMLIDLAGPLTAGQTFTLTLTFAEAGEREVTVEVRDDV